MEVEDLQALLVNLAGVKHNIGGEGVNNLVKWWESKASEGNKNTIDVLSKVMESEEKRNKTCSMLTPSKGRSIKNPKNIKKTPLKKIQNGESVSEDKDDIQEAVQEKKNKLTLLKKVDTTKEERSPKRKSH